MPQISSVRQNLLGKAVRAVNKYPKLEETIKRFSNYKLLDPANANKHTGIGAALGSSLGGTGGFLSGVPDALRATEEQEVTARRFQGLEWLPKLLNPEVRRTIERRRTFGERAGGLVRNTAIGAAGGALPGAALGRYGPRLTQKAIGRVLTPVLDPHIYDAKLHKDLVGEYVKEHGVGSLIKAVVQDRPIYQAGGAAAGRAHQFREFFGLKPFEESKGFLKRVRATPGEEVTYKFNPRNPYAMKEMRGIAELRRHHVAGSHANAKNQQLVKDKPQNLTHGTMAGFDVQPDGKYRDVWDFALHPHERPNTSEGLLRALVTPFGTPTAIEGKTLSQAAALRGSRAAIDDIHPSFIGGMQRRLQHGAKVDPQEFARYVKDPEAAKVIKGQLARQVQGRPYNFLQAMASKENLSPQDMRVLLGAPPSAKQQTAERLLQRRNLPPSFGESDALRLFQKRIQGADPQEVANMMQSLTPQDKARLMKSLGRWAQAGRVPGRELQALGDILGFKPEELGVLLG